MVNCFVDSQHTFLFNCSSLKMLCKKKIENNLNFSLTIAMGILFRGSTPSTLSYDGYLKILCLLKLFGLFMPVLCEFAEHRHNGFEAVQKLCNVSSSINNMREIRKVRQPNQCNAQAQLVHREIVRGTLKVFTSRFLL